MSGDQYSEVVMAEVTGRTSDTGCEDRYMKGRKLKQVSRKMVVYMR